MLASATPRLRLWVDGERHGDVALDPELLLLVLQDVRELGVAQERLRRDAADVEADTAPVLLLDDGDGLAELGGADRRDVATGAGTKNENIEVGHGGQPRPAGVAAPKCRAPTWRA